MAEASSSWVRAFAPATVANITCGFDILGFAVSQWGDVVEACPAAEPGVQLLEVSGDGGRLPIDPRRNTAGVAALDLLAHASREGHPAVGVRLRLRKGLPLASGLGSSAASAVAAAVAVNAALGLNAPKSHLLAAAIEGERVACGTAHADNVAPALHGGLQLVRPGTPAALTRLPVPDGLTCVLLHPHSEVATEAARAVLPAEVPLGTLTAQAGNVAALIAGLFRGDDALIASAMVDRVAEPRRAAMTPAFAEIRRAAVTSGALGCGLSGSGPTVFAWARGADKAAAIATAMREALRQTAALDGDLLISAVGGPGARLLEDGEAP